MTDFSESYAIGILQGILEYSRHNSPWVVCKMPLSIRDKYGIVEVVNFAKRWKADAIIGQFLDTDDVSLFRKNGIIAIAQDYQSKFTNIPCITGEYVRSGYIGADFFIERGYRNFAFYGLKGMVWSDERRRGFCEEIGRKVENPTINIQESIDLVNTWWYDISVLTSWLKSLPKPVAILACDDSRAYHIIEACQQDSSLKIPEEIAVLGIDNDESVCLLSSPQLSSLSQDTKQAGYDTAKMIDEAMMLPLDKRFDAVHDIIAKVTFITTRDSTDAFQHSNKVISRVLTFINQNIGNRISVSDVVSVAGMSRRSLETTFKKEIGISVYQYILKMKVKRMTELFRQGYSISEVAQALDYDDLKSMSRTFKHYVGLTFSEFIERNVR